MGKLTEAHIEQIKNMRADGTKGPEIIEFFKETYKIHLDASEISRAQHDKYSKGVASAEKPRRRVAQREYTARIKKGKEVRQDPPQEDNDFAMHIHAAYDIYKKDFLRKVEVVIR